MDKRQLVQHYMDVQPPHAAARVAVTDGQDSLSYGALEKISNQLAHYLRQNGVAPQDSVIFFLQRSVHCLTAILGTLKADAVYVPLDPKTPVQRRCSILADCSPRAILCDSTTLKHVDLAEAARKNTLVIEMGRNLSQSPDNSTQLVRWLEVQGAEEHKPDYSSRPDDLACIMYTSGSTGQPKGVMTTHRNIRSYIDWAVDYLGLSMKDKVLGTAPFHFDMSTFDVHAALKAGGTLCIANDMTTLFPEKLVKFIEEHEITTWKGVSSLLMYLARAGVLSPTRMPTLETVLFAGEPLPTKYLVQWMSAYPEKCFINAYGPTEATGVSLYYKLNKIPSSSLEKIPIGKPCAGSDVFLMKGDRIIGKGGTPGELCIAGPGLARGYLNDPLRTARSFIEPTQKPGSEQRYYLTGDLAFLRNDGNYEYISRTDRQVKVMGYRIDLGEIEHALLSIDGVEDAAVLVAKGKSADLPELVACYEASGGLTPAIILKELKTLLPGYMLPKQLHRTTEIPREDRGKVNREYISQKYSQLTGG